MSGARTITDGQGPTQTPGLIPREQALEAANLVIERIMQDCERIEIAGSIRRGRPMVHDVDLVVLAGPGARVRIGQTMREMCVDLKSFRCGDKVVSARIAGRDSSADLGMTAGAEVQVDIYFATVENFGMLFTVRTGSAQHNVYMARLAQSLDRKFAAGTGVLDRDGNVLGSKTEEEVFEAFGLPVPAPEMREIVCGRPRWM